MKSEDGPRTTKGSPIYPQVARTIAKLGHDISLARRTRRIAAEDFSRQMGVSRATLHRLENGDPGVSLNTVTMAMFVLGQLGRVADLAEPTKDDVGLMLTRRNIPKRIQREQARPATNPGSEDPEPDSGRPGGMAW